MNDREHDQLIEDFANDSVFCRHGDIKVTISPGSTSFTPGTNVFGVKGEGFRHEDAVLLDQWIHGARAFLYFLERDNPKYAIRKLRSKRNDKKGKDKKAVRRETVSR